MGLNYESVSARLYRWFYALDVPDNIGVYFLKLSLMYVVLLITGIYVLPALFKKDIRNDNYGVKLLYSSSVYVCIMIVLYFLIGLACFFIPLDNMGVMSHTTFGYYRLVTLIILISAFLNTSYNLIDRYCSKIDWINKNSDNVN